VKTKFPIVSFEFHQRKSTPLPTMGGERNKSRVLVRPHSSQLHNKGCEFFWAIKNKAMECDKLFLTSLRTSVGFLEVLQNSFARPATVGGGKMSLWRYEDRKNVMLMLIILVKFLKFPSFGFDSIWSIFPNLQIHCLQAATFGYYVGMGSYVLHATLQFPDEMKEFYMSHPNAIPGKYVHWALFGPPLFWAILAWLVVFASADRSFMCVQLVNNSYPLISLMSSLGTKSIANKTCRHHG
jgi:hypothetical protein